MHAARSLPAAGRIAWSAAMLVGILKNDSEQGWSRQEEEERGLTKVSAYLKISANDRSLTVVVSCRGCSRTM